MIIALIVAIIYTRQESGKAVIKDCVAKFNQKPDVIRKVFYDLTDSNDHKKVWYVDVLL